MPTARVRLTLLALTLVLALVTAAPYGLAEALTPPGWRFGGILLNPLDGFSYFAKMRQGQEGAWTFKLPYAAEPGEGAFIFTFYLFLGHLARTFGTSPATAFHGTRLVALAVMAAALFALYRKFLQSDNDALLGVALAIFGAGLGWLAAPLGVESSDLYIPESIPFQASLINPHFPLSIALVAMAVLLVWRGGRWIAGIRGGVIGAGLGLLQPFAVFPLLGSMIVWIGVEWWLRRTRQGDEPGTQSVWPVVGIAAGAAPFVLYDAWVSISHPVLSLWNLQNQTPSPNPLGYVTGFGLFFVGSLVAIWLARPDRTPLGRLLLCWIVINAAMLYAPFNLQRRFALGLIIPMVSLSLLSLRELGRARRWALPLLFVASIPSNLLVIAAGLAQISAASPSLLLTTSEARAYEWMDANVEPNSLVLAAPITGNRLPAFASVRVMYGHPFETPDARDQELEVVSLLRTLGDGGTQDRLIRLGVDLVFIGPNEAALGADAGAADWQPVYTTENLTILAVPAQ